MPMRDAILAEFDHEMISTRQTLERVPEGQGDWAPHEKSMKMGRLAGHVAELSGWAATIVNQDELDFRPAGASPMTPVVMTSRKELLEDLRQEGGGSAGRNLWRQRRTPAEDVDLARRRPENHGHAARGVPAQLRHEPHHSSPRAIGRLPAAEQRARTQRLRPIR